MTAAARGQRPKKESALPAPSLSPDPTQLDAVAAAWARIGVLFGIEPAKHVVDIELLVCVTARVATHDERLFVCAASWLAEHHGFVNGRRLSALAATLEGFASATLGALLSLAREAARDSAPELEAARARCCPLARSRPLFAAMGGMRVLRERVRSRAIPLFADWGLWHDDATLKPSAVRPTSWLLRGVPEIRVRALLGPSVEADLMTHALTTEVTVNDVARETPVSYAAAHAAANRLVARGLLTRERDAQRQILHPTAFARERLGRPPGQHLRRVGR